MTFPTIADKAESGALAVASFSATLPSNISSGDLLLLFIHAFNAASSINTPSGFTAIHAQVDVTNTHCRAFYKIATGSEGASITVGVASGTATYAVVALRVTGHDASAAPECGTAVTGTTTSPNPPSLSPSWGSADTLWLTAAYGQNNAEDATPPADYMIEHEMLQNGVNTVVASRKLSHSTDDPGTYGAFTNAPTAVQTYAIKPASNAVGTFPMVKGHAGTNGSAGTSQPINLPAGIVAGELLIFTVDLGTLANPTTPTGWNILPNQVSTGLLQYTYWRIADGSEGTSVTYVTGVSAIRLALAFRITNHGHSVAVAPESTVANATSATPDPPSLTPSWGALNTLWLAIGGTNSVAVSGTPTNYTDTVASPSRALRASQRELNASSDNPSAYSSASVAWGATTIGVQPAAATGRQFNAWVVT